MTEGGIPTGAVACCPGIAGRSTGGAGEYLPLGGGGALRLLAGGAGEYLCAVTGGGAFGTVPAAMEA